MKAWIDKDEWWPVYELYAEKPKYSHNEIELDADLYARYVAAYEAFKAVQYELANLVERPAYER